MKRLFLYRYLCLSPQMGVEEAIELIKARQDAERSIMITLEALAGIEDSFLVLAAHLHKIIGDVDRLKASTAKQAKELRCDLRLIRNEP